MDNEPLCLQMLLKFAIRLKIETQHDTTHFEALKSAIKLIVNLFTTKGITAHEAVIHLMECTCMLPGVFNVNMLYFRQRLQDMLHNTALFSGWNSLKYPLLATENDVKGIPSTRSITTQTNLVNPNSNEILEFNQRQFHLTWTLK